jgi:hypothetical protein
VTKSWGNRASACFVEFWTVFRPHAQRRGIRGSSADPLPSFWESRRGALIPIRHAKPVQPRGRPSTHGTHFVIYIRHNSLSLVFICRLHSEGLDTGHILRRGLGVRFAAFCRLPLPRHLGFKLPRQPSITRSISLATKQHSTHLLLLEAHLPVPATAYLEFGACLFRSSPTTQNDHPAWRALTLRGYATRRWPMARILKSP